MLNEAGAVDELYTRIAATLDGRDWEAIFVDDGSTDETYLKLRALHERDPRVRVVRFKRNFGQHPAMHAGLARALGTRIVTMDGDLQNEPEDIPKLLAVLERADVASGRRVARRDSPGRTMPSRLINGLLRRFLPVRACNDEAGKLELRLHRVALRHRTLGDERPPLVELRVGDPHRPAELLLGRHRERNVVADRGAGYEAPVFQHRGDSGATA